MNRLEHQPSPAETPISIRAQRFSIGQKGLLLVLVPIFFEVIFLLVLAALLQAAETDAAMEARLNAVSNHSSTLVRHFYGAATDLISIALSHKAEDDESFESHLKEIPVHLAKLKSIAADNAEETQLLDEFGAETDKALKIITEARASLEGGSGAWMYLKTHKLTKKFERIASRAAKKLEQVDTLERQRIKIDPAMAAKTRLSIKITVLVAVVFNIVLAIALAGFITRSMSNRIKILLDNTHRFAARKTLLPKVGGTDEIAHLDETFHSMAQAVAELHQKDVEAQRMKQEFVAMIGHDIKTPITVVQNVLGLVARDVAVPAELQSEVNIGVRECDRVIVLIDDLLDISKYEAGTFEVVVVKAPLWLIFERSALSVAQLANQKKIAITIHPTDLEAEVDPERLQQVMVNLLVNAVNASPDKTEIRVQAIQQESEVEVSVIDNGPGVPDAERESIFERFHRLPESSKQNRGGTGLGLAICKAIINGHGGQIGVADNPQGGSRFWFTVKAAPATDEPASDVHEGDAPESELDSGDQSSIIEVEVDKIAQSETT